MSGPRRWAAMHQQKRQNGSALLRHSRFRAAEAKAGSEPVPCILGNESRTEEGPCSAGRSWFLRRPSEPATVTGSVFHPSVIVRPLRSVVGATQSLQLRDTLRWIEGFRAALLSVLEGETEAVRRLVSGHELDGRPLQEPHAALFPLPFVGEATANGNIGALGVALPRGVSSDLRARVLQVVERVDRVNFGRAGRWYLGPTRNTSGSGMWDRTPWTGEPEGSRYWGTVTPVAFDRHPKTHRAEPYQEDVATLLRASCGRVGLPEPRDVIATLAAPHVGVPPAPAFPPLLRKDGSTRQHVHAILVFAEPVYGPILIGAGRYRGYGLFRAIPQP